MATRSLRQIVIAARDRAVADPSILMQGALAKNSAGDECSTTDPDAQCFCTLGLIANEAGFEVREEDTFTADRDDAYTRIGKEVLGDDNRYERIDGVITHTDDRANRRDDVDPRCPHTRVAGLAGFDYLLSTDLPE